MSDTQRKIKLPKELTESQHITQPEMLQIEPKNKKLYIGIPKENTLQENRVALVPTSVALLAAHGHRVVIEKGAGEKAHYSDHRFSEAGAEMAYSREQVFKADVILKVAPPTIEEIEWMHPDQILIAPLHFPLVSAEYIELLQKKRVTALAMEYIKDEIGSFPVVRIMSEMAGKRAMLTAAELLTVNGGGRGVLLGGVSGVPPAKVVILGAGVVGEFATKVALGLGAEVRIFDNNIYKLMRLQNRVGQALNTSSLNPFQLEKELIQSDVAIGAIHSKTGRTPVIVSEEMVTNMKAGSVIVDVSIDQGGCFATSEVTTHEKPIFEKHDIIHYCVPNIAAQIPKTASIAVSNIMTPILLKAGTFGGVASLIRYDLGLRNGVYTYKGALTNEFLGRRFRIKSTDLSLLITSDL